MAALTAFELLSAAATIADGASHIYGKRATGKTAKLIFGKDPNRFAPYLGGGKATSAELQARRHSRLGGNVDRMPGKRQKVAQKPRYRGPTEAEQARYHATHRSGYTRTAGYYGRFSGDARTRENKFFDTALNFTFDITGEAVAGSSLCLVPEGTTQSERVGRRLTIHSIQIRGSLLFVPTAAKSASISYLYLVRDRQANGAAPAVTDVLTAANMNKGLINMANSQRFHIMRRFVMPINAQAGVNTAFGEMHAPIEFFTRCNIPIDFSGSTGALTEIKSNNILLLAGSVTADDLTTIAGTARIRFSD